MLPFVLAGLAVIALIVFASAVQRRLQEENRNILGPGLVTDAPPVALRPTGEGAILLCPRFAPEFEGPPACFFGGLPSLPAALDWPIGTEGPPLHPLAQIDCAALARTAARTDNRASRAGFPERGTLFVFAALAGYALHDWAGAARAEDRPGPLRVLYTAEAAADLPPRNPPAPLPELAEGSSTASRTLWSECLPAPARPRIGRMPTLLPRLPLQPVAFDEREPIEAQRVGPATLRFPWLANLSARMATLDAKIPARHPALRPIEVPEGFPWRWVMVERVAQALDMRLPPAATPADPPAAAPPAGDWPALRTACAAWIADAAAHPETEAVDPATTAAFRDWLRDLDAAAAASRRAEPELDYILSRALGEGFAAAWPYVAAVVEAGELPQPFRGAMRRAAGSGCFLGDKPHLALGLGTEIADTPERHLGDILLLQIASDRCANLMWGDFGALQIWLAPDDLRAGRFDRCTARLEST